MKANYKQEQNKEKIILIPKENDKGDKKPKNKRTRRK